MNQRVLVMITSSVGPRLVGVARYAREHGWHLMIQDRLGPEHPFDWPCDGVVATVRRDPRAFAFLRSLVRRGVPVVDLTCDRPSFAVPRVTTDHAAADPLVRAALAWTAGHLPGRFGAAQLASALGVSRGTLDRRFAAELGRGAGAEIRRQRLALARRLLRETARPVAEIARAAGFSSAAYFCTAFQAETGATPAAWRRANGSG